jgi:serine protease Do
VYLYDENYDPINQITSGSLNAYVYDEQENCINNYAEGNGEISEGTNEQTNKTELNNTPENIEIKNRISGKEIEKYPISNLSELYERNKYAVFLIAVPQTESTYAQGTGFFISASGIGVSNYHVFADGNQDEAIAKTIDNHQYRIKRILKSDKDLDYIVFEVENDHFDFPYLTISENQIGVGEDVFAIGNPKGLEHTLSKGIVSSYRQNDQMIQTTTEITHGSSGGPLFNMKGEVIGITTSGMGEANLNFAMNIQKLGIKELTR